MTDVGTGERLIDAALSHMAETGLEGLTLRSIARDAGVSHAAPARHFEGLAVLLSAVAARSFDELAEAVRPRSTTTGDALSRLRDAGRSYLEFALANPAAYELMFRPERLDRTDPEYLRSSMGAFAVLEALVADAQAEGWNADAATPELTGFIWTTVHGIASLWIQGPLPAATGVADIEQISELANRLLDLPRKET